MAHSPNNLKAARPARKFLGGADNQLSRLAERTRFLQQIDALVREHLPAHLAGHCRVANLAAGTLSLHTESPAWASMLRFQRPRLLADLRARPGLEQLRDIRIKIVPETTAGTRGPPPPRRHLSPAAARLLRATADSTDAPALKEALRRLASRAKDR